MDIPQQGAWVEKKPSKAPEPETLMDVEATRTQLVRWLAEVKLPPGSAANGWENLIQVFPTRPEEVSQTTGVRLRLALPLATRGNKYLIAILECLDPDSRGNYLISVYVNWRVVERQMQKLVEEGYRGHFDDVLRGRHTLWAQTFREGELKGALDCCAKAILANELVGRPKPCLDGEKLVVRPPVVARFPKSEDD